MIITEKLIELKGAKRFGVCNSCGKTLSDDRTLGRITFSVYGDGGISVCLCERCANVLIEELADWSGENDT